MNEFWAEKANCRKIKGVDFFSDDLSGIRKAKTLCSKCEVAAECLKQSIEFEEIYGVWGGLSQRERRKYHKLYKKGIDYSTAKEIVILYGNKSITN